jgi:hypothetical protein
VTGDHLGLYGTSEPAAGAGVAMIEAAAIAQGRLTGTDAAG